MHHTLIIVTACTIIITFFESKYLRLNFQNPQSTCELSGTILSLPILIDYFLTGNDSMSKLLEIFGKGLNVNIAEVVGHWLNQKLSQEQATDRTDFLVEIHDSLVNREFNAAKTKLQQYLTGSPECILGRMAAVILCLFQNDLTEAIKQAQSVYFREPANTMALYVMGYCYERMGETIQALEFYQDCVKFKNFLQLPRQRMAAIYLKEGQLERAVKEYEILTSEHPDDISSIVLLGYLYLEANKEQQAVDTFNLGILSHPDNFANTGENEEIETYVESGMFEEALEYVKNTIDQMGISQDLLVQMGDIYSRWEKESQSIACYENAILMQPNSLEARIKLGTHYLRNQRFSLAAEEFNKASDINDEIVDAYMGLAIAQNKLGLHDESLDTLAMASSIEKNSILLQTEATTLLLQSILNDNYNPQSGAEKDVVTIEHVIKAYQRRIKNLDAHAEAHAQYGVLMVNEGNHMAAICAFENSLSRNPLNYRVKYKSVLSYFDNKQINKASDILMNMDHREASKFEKYYQITMLYADKEKFATSIKKAHSKIISELHESKNIQEDIQQILILLGVIERSDVNWQQINQMSGFLLELFDNKRQYDHRMS